MIKVSPQLSAWLRNLLRPLIIGVFAVTAAAAQDGDYAVALTTITFENRLGVSEAAIWYPSETPEENTRLGPFDISIAKDGAPAAGRFPVVLFSHGHSGRWRNHYLTALALARAGMIVITPQHTSDIARLRREITHTEAIEIRIHDMPLALQAAADHPVVRQIGDTDRLAAAGYSLGGLTALAAGGGKPSMHAFHAHCLENGDLDGACQLDLPFFAAALQFFFKTVRSVTGRKREVAEISDLPPPLDLRAIAVVAPVGSLFTAGSLDAVTAPVFIHRLGDDEEVSYPFHAENIKRLIGARAHVQVHDNIGHYTFVGPFPERFAEELEKEGIPRDPPGFDRAAFIEKVNRQIIAALVENLAPE